MTTRDHPSAVTPSTPVSDRPPGADGEVDSQLTRHVENDVDAQLDGHRHHFHDGTDSPFDADGDVLDLRRLMQENAGLRARLDTLPVIEQSKGILMARYQIGPDDAFELLRRWSSHTNHKLRHLSRLIVDAAARPTRTRANPAVASPGPSLDEILTWLHSSINSGRRPTPRPPGL